MKNLLLKTALKSSRLQRHATIVLKGGAILAVGYNTSRLHSEVSALNKLWPNKRVGTRLINLRISPGGKIKNSSPCERCKQIMEANGVIDCFVWEE